MLQRKHSATNFGESHLACSFVDAFTFISNCFLKELIQKNVEEYCNVNEGMFQVKIYSFYFRTLCITANNVLVIIGKTIIMFIFT